MKALDNGRIGAALGDVQRAIAWAGLLSALLGPALALSPLPGGVGFAALVVFACVAPGAACVCHVRLGDPVAAWAVVLVLSMSLTVIAAVTLAWARWWEPGVGIVIVAALSAASCVVALLSKETEPGAAPAPGTRLSGSASLHAHDATTLIPRQGADSTASREGRTGGADADAAAWGPHTPHEERGDETTVIPRIGGPVSGALSDATTVLPHVGGATLAAAADQTQVITRIEIPSPRRTPGGADETTVIPKITDAATPTPSDATTVIPRITDATTVIPRIGDTAPPADETTVLSRVTAQSPATAQPSAAAQPEADAEARPLSAYDRLRLRRRDLAIAVLTLTAGTGAWVLALIQADLADVDDFGLLSAMPPAYFAALTICVLGFVWEVSRRSPRAWAAVGHTVLLLAIMHATVPALLAEPEYAWTYKHLGVIDLIASGRPMDNAYDVYQQWPAFFALVAQLTETAGVSALRIASWAPVFFGLINLLPAYAIFRTLSTDRRVPYLAAFVFSAVNWVAQDYLAPQAFAYTLSLGALLVLLRWLRRDPAPAKEIGPRFLRRLWAWAQTGMGPLPYTSSRAKTLSLVTLYVVYAAIVVSHQLSPYLIAISATALVAFRLVQTVQILPIFGVIAILQLIPRYRLVESWGLFDGFNLFANAQPLAPTQGEVSAGRTFSVMAIQVLALSIWLVATIVVIANRKRLGPLAVPAALAAGPFAILVGNSYGGEAVFRIFLFSSPWCAYLITVGLLRLRMRAGWGIGLAVPTLVLATLVAVQGEHGQLQVNAFTSDEVRAAQYLYANVPDGAAIVMAGANYPDRIGARYTDVLGAVGTTDTLLPTGDSEGAVVLGEAMDETDLDAINSYFDQYSMPAFLVVSKSQAHAAAYFGYYRPDRLDKLRALLDGSPKWQLWYGNDDTRIFRYVPNGTAK
ncbi:MAG: hypothetical protein HOV79_12975 [Hamadaea sp.]|nr:hypothetical protein [Hamadaea sp.]